MIKVMLLLTYATLMWVGCTSHFAANSDLEGKKVNRSGSTVKKNGIIGWIGLSYLLGIVGIELWSQLFHHHVFGDRLPFLPHNGVILLWPRNDVLLGVAARMYSQTHMI